MKRIICVDDDASLRNVFSLIFERAGYDITIYSDGHNIMESKFQAPDIFILDKQLPGITGLDICRFLKSQSKTCHVPVILISASPSLAEHSKDVGADAYLEKPFKLKDILGMVDKYVSLRYAKTKS